MATLNFLKRKDAKSKGALGSVIAYCVQEHKTKYEDTRLISGVNCSSEHAMRDFNSTKRQFGKEDGVQFYYAVQSFDEGLKIDPVLAHQMAIEWTEKCYPGFEALVTTHLDTDSVHSHIIINSVSAEDGHKIHQNKNDLIRFREINDEICLKYGAPVCIPKKKTVKPMKPKEYFIAKAGKSWKFRMINAIEYAMRFARNKNDFIRIMNENGFEVKWTDSRKNITYTDSEGHKCRDDNLHEDKFLKQNMEAEFETRLRLSKAEQSDDSENGESYFGNDSGEPVLAGTHRTQQELQPEPGTADENSSGSGRYVRVLPSDDSEDGKTDERLSGEDNAASELGDRGPAQTGWEAEREYYLSNKGVEEYGRESEDETPEEDSFNHGSYSADWVGGLYFAGNLAQMIQRHKQNRRRKHVRLSDKEIAKRRAHGQRDAGSSEDWTENDGYSMYM